MGAHPLPVAVAALRLAVGLLDLLALHHQRGVVGVGGAVPPRRRCHFALPLLGLRLRSFESLHVIEVLRVLRACNLCKISCSWLSA
jgi:hypothetical protein